MIPDFFPDYWLNDDSRKMELILTHAVASLLAIFPATIVEATIKGIEPPFLPLMPILESFVAAAADFFRAGSQCNV